MARDGNITPEAKRSSRRTPVPPGTLAILKNDFSSIDAFYVSDISEEGMLISTNSSEEAFPVGSLIDSVFIVIPSQKTVKVGQETDNRSCFVLNQGKVVRSTFDQDSLTAFYGISFIDNNSYSKKDITTLVEILQKQIL